jgi:hypothetical protein
LTQKRSKPEQFNFFVSLKQKRYLFATLNKQRLWTHGKNGPNKRPNVSKGGPGVFEHAAPTAQAYRQKG